MSLQVILDAMADDIARRDEFQGLYVTVRPSTYTDEIEVRLYDPSGMGVTSVDLLPGQAVRVDPVQFGHVVAKTAEKVLANLRAFQAARFVAPVALSRECPCGIHRSRCEYHAVPS